jgi:acyl carrier protein
MEERVKKIMASVFELEISKIDDDTSPETVSKWVSLQHMNLVLSLEDEFTITFEEDEIIELLSYPAIIAAVNRKIKG